MLINFFFTLRAAKLKVSVKEYLMLLEAIKAGVMDADAQDLSGPTVDKFYYLARTALVKDEANFDKFDRAFAAYFKGVELLSDGVAQIDIPERAAVHSVFEAADNVAVTALEVRPFPTDPLRYEAFVQVFNASPGRKHTRLTLRGAAGFSLSQELDLAPAEQAVVGGRSEAPALGGD